jgi:xylulokinase
LVWRRDRPKKTPLAFGSGYGVLSPADVFNSLIVTVNSVEGPAYGAAILAAVGTGASDTVEDTCERWIRVETKIRPDEERSRLYKKLYSIYRGMYPVLKPAFDDMSSIFEG